MHQMGTPPLNKRKVVVRFGTRGFTLIELMIVVAIVAITAAVALPSYLGSIRKGRRADAIAEVSRVEQAQERWRANNPTYNNDVSSNATTGLRLASGTTAATTYNTPAGYYSVALSGNVATAYVVTLSAVAGTSQTRDTNCQCMRVSWALGNATYQAANSTTGSCGTVTWTSANAAACWRR